MATFAATSRLLVPRLRWSAAVPWFMAETKVWTAAELERMTPEERQRLFDESVVTDLTQLDPEFLERVRARGRVLLEERGLIARQGDGG